jgi:hypothetical protein
MNHNLVGSIYERSSIKMLISSQSVYKNGHHRQFFGGLFKKNLDINVMYFTSFTIISSINIFQALKEKVQIYLVTLLCNLVVIKFYSVTFRILNPGGPRKSDVFFVVGKNKQKI